MSNDYDYVQIEAIAKEVVSHYRGSPTAIAKLYAFEHLLAQGRYAEILSLKNAIEQDLEDHKRVSLRLSDCESALKSMVQQYCYRPLDAKTKEPCEAVYQHDFMSAGEEACRYMVENHLAEWTDEDKYAIRFTEVAK